MIETAAPPAHDKGGIGERSNAHDAGQLPRMNFNIERY
jgi:hypothetical protein